MRGGKDDLSREERFAKKRTPETIGFQRQNNGDVKSRKLSIKTANVGRLKVYFTLREGREVRNMKDPKITTIFLRVTDYCPQAGEDIEISLHENGVNIIPLADGVRISVREERV